MSTNSRSATPAMRAVTVIQNRLRMTMEERALMPVSLEEADVLTGAAESCWSHYGFHQLMNIAIRTGNIDVWIKVAALLERVPVQKRVVGVFQYFADNTPIESDAKWGCRCVRRMTDALWTNNQSVAA